MDYIDYHYYLGTDLVYPTPVRKPVIDKKATTPEAFRTFADELEQYEKDKATYLVEYSKVQVVADRRYQELLQLLQDHYQLREDKFMIIWDEAYECAHAYSLEEVVGKFKSLYSFVKKFNGE